MAFGSVHDILLRVLGDEDDAQNALEQLAAQLAVFSKITAEAEADVLTDEAQRKLRELQARLDLIDLSSADVKLQADVAQAMAELQAVEMQVEKIDGRTATVDVDVRRGVLERINGISNGILTLGRRIRGANDSGQSWLQNLAGLRFALGPLAGRVDVMAGLIAVLIPAITALGAAIVALASSLGAAVAGFGALAVAAGGVAMPAIGLVFAAIARFKDQSDVAGTAAHALSNAFKGIGDAAKSLLPAADPVFRALAEAIGGLPQLLSAVQPAFAAFGRAAAGSIRAFTDILSSPLIAAGISNMVRLASEALTPMAQIGAQLFRIFLNIAQAAMPALTSALEGIAGGLGDFAAKTDNIGRLRGVIDGLVGHLGSWLNLLGQIGRAFINIGAIAAPFGQALVDMFAEGARKLADWAASAEGAATIKQFFEDVMPLAEAMIGLFAELIPLFIQIGQVLAPALAPTVQILTFIIGFVNDLIGAFLDLPEPIRTAFIGGLAIAIALASGIGIIATIIIIVIGALALLGAAFRGLGGIASSVFGAVKGAISSVVGTIASVASSIWSTVSGIIGKAINFVIHLPRGAIGLATSLWATVSGLIRRGISFIINLPRAAIGLASSLWGTVSGIIRRSIAFIINLPRAAAGIASSLWNTVSNTITRAIDFVIDLDPGGIISTAESVWNTVSDILGATIHMNVDVDVPGPLGSFHPIDEAGTLIGRTLNMMIQRAVTPVEIPVAAVSVGALSGASGGAAGAFGVAAGAGVTNNFQITTPDGDAPDVETMLAQLDLKLKARGAWG